MKKLSPAQQKFLDAIRANPGVYVPEPAARVVRAMLKNGVIRVVSENISESGIFHTIYAPVVAEPFMVAAANPAHPKHRAWCILSRWQNKAQAKIMQQVSE